VKSYKVFVVVDPLVAASRVMGNQRGNEEVYTDLEDAKTKLIERSRLENERFIDIYGVNNLDYSNYNLVIDSTYSTPDILANIIYDKFRDYCMSGAETHDVVMAPASLYPLAGISELNLKKLELYREKKEYLNSFATVIVFDGYHYIVDGYHQVLAAIMNGESFIDVELVDTDNHSLFKSQQHLISTIQAVGISAVHDFEKTGNFRYKSYPDYYFDPPLPNAPDSRTTLRR